jgi:hypothetical protein
MRGRTAVVTPEARILGWYLYNILQSDCCELLLDVVDRFAPSVHGRPVKPEKPWSPPGSRSAGPTADGESIAAQTELELLLAAFEIAPTISSVAEMNARHAATALGLDPLEEQLLLLVLRSGAPWQPIRKFLDAAYGEVQELPRLAAALLGAETHEVEIRLQRSARLATCGLVSVDMTPVGDFSSTARLLLALPGRCATRTAQPKPGSKHCLESK